MSQPEGDAVDIAVSVVSGSDAANVLGFVDSVLPALELTGRSFRVAAIVNAPDPALARELRERKGVAVTTRNDPVGFAANHNEAIRSVRATYYVIANDDVVVEPNAVAVLTCFMDDPTNHDVAVVSPKLLNPDGTLQPSTYSFPTTPRSLLGMTGLREHIGTGPLPRVVSRFLGKGPGQSRLWAHDRRVDVETLRGAFVVVRGAAIRDVGPMDEVSLVGGEETEWHYRMRRRGWRIVFAPEAAVRHVGSATVGGRSDLEIEYLKGELNFYAKHRSRLHTTAMRVGGCVIHAARWSAAVARRDEDRRRASAAAVAFLVRPR